MGKLLIPLSSLLSGVGLLVVGVGLLFSVVGLRAGLADFSGLTLGLVMSAYFAGFVLGTYVCPVVIRRVGHIRAFAAMASVASTMPILHALWIDPWFWGVLRLITGVCLVGLYMVVESWLNALAPNDQRGKVFAAYMSVNFVALALGQWLILVGDRLGFVPFAMVSVMFSFALLPITLTPVEEPEPVEAPVLSLRKLYEASPLGTAAAFVSGVLNGTFFGMGALYAQGVGFSDTGVAAFMAATILGGAVFQWPVGHYSDRHDRRLVLFWVCTAASVLAGLSLLLLTLPHGALTLLGLFYGGLVFTIYGLGVAHVNDVIDSSRLLEFTGGLLLVHGAGAALGPTVGGVVMDQFGAASLMPFFGFVLAALALYTIKRMRVAPPVPEEAKAEYVVMGGGSQAVLQMDPRTSPESEGDGPHRLP
ncbi:MAG TPA: MFS transporter [Hydrogenophaga sp.]|uniref:MFS transporter n=1 Tax=Hydrogenophaga sp. TaxID=1904254 RepID=UPI002C68421A|nr:MFS transporter [Hydrogenophaga sp.]HMN93312.1 MFS transporter [Hydrogenophaga sp.]HMP10693.1 MFS transporter [Hydrogenophaga sp.]